MAETEFELGQSVISDSSSVTIDSLGTPAGDEINVWSHIAGSPDAAAVDDATKEANIVAGETGAVFQPPSEGVTYGGRGAKNKIGYGVVWSDPVRVRDLPNTYFDDFTSYANSTELNAAWTKPPNDTIVLVSDANAPGGKALKLGETINDYTAIATWNAVSDRLNNGGRTSPFQLYAEIRGNRGDGGSPWEIRLYARGGYSRTWDDTNPNGTAYFSVLWEFDGSNLNETVWLKGDPEPGAPTATYSVTEADGYVGVARRIWQSDVWCGYISAGFNGEAAPRPA